MALDASIFDNIGACDDDENAYLADASEGIRLVATIISQAGLDGRSTAHMAAKELISGELISALSALQLPNELNFVRRLEALGDRLAVPEKHKLLKNHTVIGVGGQFSSGKSSFLNNLLGESEIKLPEGQTPSTAIPSYIVNGPQETAHAYNVRGSEIELDTDAIDAISHAFKEQYGMGLAQYISFLAITAPGLPEGIALLDTPGYNKADIADMKAYSDRARAREELQSIDFLIWLTDVKNGTLAKEDIDFIKGTGVSTPVLIVVNKCDLKPEQEVASVLAETKRAAEEGLSAVYDVVAYSAGSPEEFSDGAQRITDFIAEARGSGIQVENLNQKLQEIASEILVQANNESWRVSGEKDSLGELLADTRDPLAMQGVAMEYAQTSRQLLRLHEGIETFEETVDRLDTAMTEL